MTNGDDVSVLLVDDHEGFRKEARRILLEGSGVQVVAEADSGAAAIATAQHTPAVLAILDLEMPGMDGITLARALGEIDRSMKLIMLTVHCSPSLVRRAFRAGITGYVVKDDAATDLLPCVHAVMNGDRYVSPRVMGGAGGF